MKFEMPIRYLSGGVRPILWSKEASFSPELCSGVISVEMVFNDMRPDEIGIKVEKRPEAYALQHSTVRTERRTQYKTGEEHPSGEGPPDSGARNREESTSRRNAWSVLSGISNRCSKTRAEGGLSLRIIPGQSRS